LVIFITNEIHYQSYSLNFFFGLDCRPLGKKQRFGHIEKHQYLAQGSGA
jgi:hypothetical protein